jgi:CHAT domain-containing protein
VNLTKDGAAAIIRQDQNQLRRYLLGQLAGADEEAVETRLLTDADYAEWLDVVVDELIDQYACGEVSAEERAQLERHFLRSPERRAKLRFALALKRRASERESRRRPPRRLARHLPVAASLLLVAGLGVVICLTFFRRSDVSDGLVALRAAYGGRRPVEARISDFPYAPDPQLRGGEGSDSLQDDLAAQRDLAASLLIRAAATRPKDAAAQRAAGQHYLAARQFDEAIKYLQASLSLDPRDARAHSDLGVALLERGKSRGAQTGGGMRDFGESLAHLDQAVELDDSLLEALFNRALAHEYLSQTAEAENDWRAYLAKDPGSKWADEARQRLSALEERRQNQGASDRDQLLRDFYSAYERGDDEKGWRAFRRSYTSAGNTITNALLDSFLDTRAAGEGNDADGKLRALEYAGQLESRRAGDSYTTELARFYRRARPAQLRVLARARGLARTGYERMIHSQSEAALRDLKLAKSSFEEVGDEYESALVEHLIGVCYFFRLDRANAEPSFRRLLAFGEERGCAWLLGQSLYRLAMLRQSDNKPSEAIEYDRLALEKFERIGDLNSTLKVLTNLADEYQSLNDEQQSLGFIGRALAMADEDAPERGQVWGIYTAAGLSFDSLDLSAAALPYQREALRLAAESGQPLNVSRSHAYLGMTYAKLRRYDEALEHVRQAYEAGSPLSGETSGQEMMANASLYAGEIYRRRGDPDRAIESYDRAINFYASLDFPYFRYVAHRGKLLALLARDNDQSSARELQTVLDIFEQYRLDVTGEGLRDKFFDVEQGVYDRAIAFAYARKRDSSLAFDYSELSRARSLLDATRGQAQAAGDANDPKPRPAPGSAPLLVSEIQRRMPARAQILQFAVLDDRVLAWLVTRAEVWSEEIPVDSHALEEEVRAYLRAAGDERADGTDEAARGAQGLYDLLIRRFETRLDKAKLLCVVPDKFLHQLPFAALVSKETGKYLVEDYQLETSPSSTVFVECSERASRKAAAPEKRLLSVGNPSFDRGAFPALQPLPAAAAEARAITRFYESSLPLLAVGAREKAVRDEIGKSDVANFALHYVVDDESSLLSGMALAGERSAGAGGGDDDGFWQVGEIYKMSLPRTRLVVLSACRTGVEREYRGEGAVSVARPFIAAGVPLVVASLWSVDSESAARLVFSLHRNRTHCQESTAEALRQAQLEMLKDERYSRPRYWAAFTLIGGYAEF